MKNLENFRQQELSLPEKQIIRQGGKLKFNRGYQLERLRIRNLDPTHINNKIYHLLCDPFSFINAYSKISKNLGALTKGIEEDEESIKSFDMKTAEQTAKMFKDHNYKWKPIHRGRGSSVCRETGKKKKRPIETPTQIDRIVQETIRGILESIYEPEFKQFEQENGHKCTNYGFRTKKSTWEGIQSLQMLGKQCNYAIKGYIVGAYKYVDHNKLLTILGRRIKDKRFLKVISELLKSGVMEGKLIDNIKGQGGILSPLLFNIYMFELDKFIHNQVIKPLMSKGDGKVKKAHPRCRRIRKMRSELRQLRRNSKPNELKTAKRHMNMLIEERNTIPYTDLESIPPKAVYCRYVDDWALFITGKRADAVRLKLEIAKYLSENLHMELDREKTLVTHLVDGMNFLGFTLRMTDGTKAKIGRYLAKHKDGLIRIKRKSASRIIKIYPDKNRLLMKMRLSKYCNSQYRPVARRSWTALTEYEIVLRYYQIWIGLYNYFARCDNVHLLYRISYILTYSCAKTIAVKQNITITKVFAKYGKDLRMQRTAYKNEKPKAIWVTLPSMATTRKAYLAPKLKLSLRNEHG